MRLIFACLFAIVSLSAAGQEAYFDDLDPKAVTIRQDKRVMGMLEAHAEINRQVDEEEGYRIQINHSKDKNLIFTEKGKFYKEFSEMDVYVVYEQPYYKLRIGDYDNRLDATRALMEIVEVYQRAFIISDNILIK